MIITASNIFWVICLKSLHFHTTFSITKGKNTVINNCYYIHTYIFSYIFGLQICKKNSFVILYNSHNKHFLSTPRPYQGRRRRGKEPSCYELLGDIRHMRNNHNMKKYEQVPGEICEATSSKAEGHWSFRRRWSWRLTVQLVRPPCPDWKA